MPNPRSPVGDQFIPQANMSTKLLCAFCGNSAEKDHRCTGVIAAEMALLNKNNVKPYTYTLQTNGGAAWLAEGDVNISPSGNINLNEYPLYHFFEQFKGQHVEIAVMPVTSQYIIDEKIKPLLLILLEKGHKPISSCEGHIRHDGIYRPYPWVAFQSIPWLQHGYASPPEGSGWVLTHFKEDDPLNTVAIWKPVEEAKDINDLNRIQDTYINALIENLKSVKLFKTLKNPKTFNLISIVLWLVLASVQNISVSSTSIEAKHKINVFDSKSKRNKLRIIRQMGMVLKFLLFYFLLLSE